MKNTDIGNIRKMAEHYNVDIEIKFGKDFRAIVSNSDEGVYIKNGFDVNLIDEIDKACIEIRDRHNVKMVEVNKRLDEIDESIFPKNLFKKEEGK